MFRHLTVAEVLQELNNHEVSQNLVKLLLADGRKGLKDLAIKVENQIKAKEKFLKLWEYEKLSWDKGETLVGTDEVGRGPLAGPVVAAAVSFKEIPDIIGINDSKRLNENTREDIAQEIKKCASYSISMVHHDVIDKINILNASKLAMVKAVKGLNLKVDLLLIDGNFKIDYPSEQKPIIKGDMFVGSIAAASILAKVFRDDYMLKLHEKYPMYNFKQNKGYPTEEHYWALRKHGPSKVHRISFNGVKEGA